MTPERDWTTVERRDCITGVKKDSYAEAEYITTPHVPAADFEALLAAHTAQQQAAQELVEAAQDVLRLQAYHNGIDYPRLRTALAKFKETTK